MAIYKERAIVLSGFRLGEADRVVVLLTPGHGKVRAVAKGIRKTKSRFGARLEPLVHVDLLLHSGKSLGTVTGAEIVEPFREVREDLDRLTIASSMAEAADRLAQEHEPSPMLYKLLLAALRELELRPPGRVMLAGYLMRLLEVAGFAMALGPCIGCGVDGPHTRIGIADGGSLCRICGGQACLVEPGTMALLEVLSSAKMARANELEVPQANAAEATGVALRFVEYHLDRRLKSINLSSVMPREASLVQT